MDKKQPNRTFEMLQKNFFAMPLDLIPVMEKISPCSIKLMLILFSDISTSWSLGYDLYFVADLAKRLSYTTKMTRKALIEIASTEYFLIYDLEEKGKFILYNNPKNLALYKNILEGSITVDVKDKKFTLGTGNKTTMLNREQSYLVSSNTQGTKLPSNREQNYPLTGNKTTVLNHALTGVIIDVEPTPTDILTNTYTEGSSLVSYIPRSSEVKKGGDKKETEETKKTFKNELKKEEKKPTSKTSTFNLDLSNLIELEKKDSIPTTGILTRSNEIDKNAINSHANIQTIVNEQNRAKVISDNDKLLNINKDSLVIDKKKHVPTANFSTGDLSKASFGVELLETFKPPTEYEIREKELREAFDSYEITHFKIHNWMSLLDHELIYRKYKALLDNSKVPPEARKKYIETMFDNLSSGLSQAPKEKTKEEETLEQKTIKKWSEAWLILKQPKEMGINFCHVNFLRILVDDTNTYSIGLEKRCNIYKKRQENLPKEHKKTEQEIADLELSKQEGFQEVINKIKKTGITYNDIVTLVDIVQKDSELIRQVKCIKEKRDSDFFIKNLSEFWKV